MDPSLVNLFANLGGMGLLSGALFFLWLKIFDAHQTQLKEDREVFRKELHAEREQCAKDHERIMTALTTNHAAVLEALWASREK